jgi:kumamolisin
MISVVVVVRPRQLDHNHPLREQSRHNVQALPHDRRPLSARELGMLHGASKEDIQQVVDFAHRTGLDVSHASALRGDVTLAGSVRKMGRAFGVELRYYDHQWGRYHSHANPIRLPRDLAPIVEAVLGLDNTPLFRRHSHQVPASAVALHTVADIARAYEFPRGTGRGQRIALLEFGGGFHTADLNAFFAKHGRGRAPRVRARPLLGTRNSPAPVSVLRAGTPTSQLDPRFLATVETTLDIEIAGAIAPDATIDVFFAPNHARGYRDSILTALGLNVFGPRLRPATVISISWGASEPEWTVQALEAINDALARAHDMGVTVCCASGDQGSCGTQAKTRLARVDFPASSPYALACGGTSLQLRGKAKVCDERAWNSAGMATGGGVSGHFARHEWQTGIGIPVASRRNSGLWVSQGRRAKGLPGRGVPDVAANADPNTGYEVIVGGRIIPGCGTSAAAPLWAGLLAVIAEQLGKPPGALNALIYRPDFCEALNEIARGDSRLPGRTVRYFRAHPGWNACTGLGSPAGGKLLSALRRK